MSMLAPFSRTNPFPRNLMFDPFDFFNPVAPRETSAGFMRTDIAETPDAFELSVDLPGFKKEDVNATFKDGYLSISATTRTESEDKDDAGTVLRKERFSGSCSRTFFVGDEIVEEDITAAFEDGVLRINVPKQKEQPKLEQARSIAIN